MHKRAPKVTRGRGRGGKQKIAGRFPTNARPLEEMGVLANNQNNYNNEILVKNSLVTKAPSRRGRPRSRVSSTIMYLPVKQLEQPLLPQRQLDPCQIAPVMPMPRCPIVVQPIENYHHPVNFRAQSMSIDISPYTSQGSEKNIIADHNQEWPEDLEELVTEWDNLPHGHLWEVVKWLSAPVMPIESPVPLMVANIQEMMAEWDETHDNQVQQVVEWLGLCYSCTSISTPQVIPPKVVVEAQPASIQDCSQWSSMVEHRESLEQ